MCEREEGEGWGQVLAVQELLCLHDQAAKTEKKKKKFSSSKKCCSRTDSEKQTRFREEARQAHMHVDTYRAQIQYVVGLRWDSKSHHGAEE